MGRKVCIVGTAHPFRGGMADYNESLARAFQKNGDEVTIINFTTQYPSLFFPGKTQYTSEAAPEGLQNLRCLSSVNPLSWIKTGLRIKKMQPDIVMINYWLPLMAPALGTVARIVKSNRHSRLLSVVHNMVPHEKRPGDRLLSKYFIAPIDGFLTMARKVFTDLREFDNKKPVVFHPHPIYEHYGTKKSKTEARSRLGLDSEKKYLLFFGFIRDYKGLDLLLKAIKAVSREFPEVQLVVAGEFYAKADYYLDLIKTLEIEDAVILKTEFIPREAVADYFCAADLVVQPYKSATQSGVTQIAYHFEKPMVVTNVGGLGELVPDGKTGLVTDTEPQAIANAVIRYFNEALEASFTENMKEEKKRYSWAGLLHTLDELDKMVIKGGQDGNKK